MNNVNFDAFLDTIRSNKPPFHCPVESCNKLFRKYEDIQMHLQGDLNQHAINTQINRKGRLRKSIKHDVCPPKVRVVEFKYNSQVERLCITQTLKVNIVSSVKERNNDNEINSELHSNESKCKSNSKFKIRSKLNKAKCESSTNNQSQLNLQLPEPSYRMLNSSVNEFKEPNDTSVAYYRYLDDSVDEDDQINVEYDMDEEDSIWLDMFNCKRRNERLLDVSADTFELMMDRLEKESFFQSQHNGNDVGPAIDEDAVCSICNDGECQNSNAILFCDMCNLAVHQECYGVPYIPEGQWLCRRCMQSPSRAVDCVLCPNKGGAFKQTDDNRWAHVICALWIPEVCFANTVFLEPIDSIVAIPTARWRLTCCVCHQKNSGACIQCQKSNCYVAFHVTCAQQAGLYMKIEAVKEVTQQGLITSIRKTAYCFTHAPASKNGASNGIYSSGDEENKTETKRNEKIKDKIKKARRLLAEKRSSIPIVSIPTIPIKRLTKIAELVSFPRRNEFLIKLYAYWKLKRQSRNGVPLLRRLQNSNSTMRIDLCKEKSKRDNIKFRNQYKKLVEIRRNLEKARLLLELIRKREKIKIQIIKEMKNSTIYKLTPFKQFLLSILQKIVEKDVNQFFLEPVSVEEVPDYLSYIKTPMDLGTMRKKVEHHEYVSFQDFENHLYLIVDNCMLYNEKDTIWHKAALKLKDCIKIILNEYKPFLDLYDQKSGIHIDDCRQNSKSKPI